MNTYNSYSSNINKTNIILPDNRVMSPITSFSGYNAFCFSSTGKKNFSPTELFLPGTTLYYVFTTENTNTGTYPPTLPLIQSTIDGTTYTNAFTINTYSNISILLVGGGGTGGPGISGNSGGGGGAGQVKYLSDIELSGYYYVCVGAGGLYETGTNVRKNGYVSFISSINNYDSSFNLSYAITAYGGGYGSSGTNLIARAYDSGTSTTDPAGINQNITGSYGGGANRSWYYGGGDNNFTRPNINTVTEPSEAVQNGYAGGFSNKAGANNGAVNGGGGGGGAGGGGYPSGTLTSSVITSTNNSNGGKGGDGVGGINTIYHTILSDISNSNLMPNSSVWVNSLKDSNGYLYIGGGGEGGYGQSIYQYYYGSQYSTRVYPSFAGLGGGSKATRTVVNKYPEPNTVFYTTIYQNTGGGGAGGGASYSYGSGGGSGLVVIRVQL